MAAQTYVHNGSGWQELTNLDRPYVKVSGTWQGINQIWAKDGGTWRQVYQYDSTPPVVSAYTVTGQSNAKMRFAWSGGPLVTDAASAVSSVKIQAQYTPYLGAGEGWTDVYYMSAAEWTASSGYLDFTPSLTKRYKVSGNINFFPTIDIPAYYMGFRVVAADVPGNTTTTSEVKAFTKPQGTIYFSPTGQDSYQGGWLGLSSHAVRSGDADGNGTSDYEYGCYFYGTTIADNCLGYTPDSGAFNMRRYTNWGSSGNWSFYLHNKTTNSGAGATLSGTAATVSVSGDNYQTNVNMPSDWLAPLAAGTVRGIALDSVISWRTCANWFETWTWLGYNYLSDSGRLWLNFT